MGGIHGGLGLGTVFLGFNRGYRAIDASDHCWLDELAELDEPEFQESKIDRFLLSATISSIGVPSGPRTSDTTQALLRQELKNHLIHEGTGRGAGIPLQDSIFHRLILKTALQLGDIETIQYDKTGPPAYSRGGWKSHCRRKQIKRTHGTKYVGGSTEVEEFATSPIPDEYNCQKPDIALFDFALKDMGKTWADVLSFVEHTSSDLAKKQDIPVFWGSITKAHLILREQPWHRSVVGFSICANQFRAHYFDRSGLIISRPFQIHKKTGPIQVTEMLGTLMLSDSHHLGFDPTIHMCNAACIGTHSNLACEAKGWVKDNHAKMYSIMEVLWKSHGLFCHGTVCYCVVDEAGNEYTLKDCWVTEEKKNHETTILEMVKGIPNVVQLIDHWDVHYEEKPDCTARIRSQYDTNHRDDLMFCNRFHCRTLLSPCGRPLSKFSSRWELLTAFRAFVVAHHRMIENHVLHGDLSPNNFVIHNGISYFIDFDHASILAEGMTSTYSHDAGTMPYISIHILYAMLDLALPDTGANIPGQDANPNDYGGPHGEVAHTWSPLALPWASTYEALGKADSHLALSTVCFMKLGALMEHKYFATKASEYFAEFRPLIKNWVIMVYNANRRDNQVEMTHAGVLDILDVFMRSIGEEPPPSGQSQSLRSRTSQSLHPKSTSSALRTPLAGPSEP
ncbi:hypothetical protein DFH29DRAFT_1064956 [Suillus ampliporus]|nr:hypothetical protein DFH29DRAFT_1064956 [Suillus ampliporus]